jgi:hypothetical protein
MNITPLTQECPGKITCRKKNPIDDEEKNEQLIQYSKNKLLINKKKVIKKNMCNYKV